MVCMRKEMTKISELVAKKNGAKAKVQGKVDALIRRREVIDAEIEIHRTEIAQKDSEIEALAVLLSKAQRLDKRSTEILIYLQELSSKFEAIEWRPDMPEEEKIGSSDYREKADERYALEDEIADLLKEANKIYWRS